jgi:hypothetical protein
VRASRTAPISAIPVRGLLPNFAAHSPDDRAGSAWDQLGTMLTIGYVAYTNSDDMRARFLSDRLDTQRARFFEESVQPDLEPRAAPSVLHLAGAVDTEAARALTRVIRASVVDKLSIVTADPTGAAFQPHTWYAQHVYNTYAVLARRRAGADVHNLHYGTRCAVSLIADDRQHHNLARSGADRNSAASPGNRKRGHSQR